MKFPEDDRRDCFNCRFRDGNDCCSNQKSLHEGDNVFDVLVCGKWEDKKNENYN